MAVEQEVTHSCLMSLGVHDGINWDDHYMVDQRGRRYREWISLIGLNEPGDLNARSRICTFQEQFKFSDSVIRNTAEIVKILYTKLLHSL